MNDEEDIQQLNALEEAAIALASGYRESEKNIARRVARRLEHTTMTCKVQSHVHRDPDTGEFLGEFDTPMLFEICRKFRFKKEIHQLGPIYPWESASVAYWTRYQRDKSLTLSRIQDHADRVMAIRDMQEDEMCQQFAEEAKAFFGKLSSY